MKIKRIVKLRYIFLLALIIIMLMIVSSCSLFDKKSGAVIAPKLDLESAPRICRVLPDYTNEGGEKDFYIDDDEDVFMPVVSKEKVHLIIDYINRDNLSINKVVLASGNKEFDVNAKEFVSESSPKRTIIELTIDEVDEPQVLSYSIKKILYNVRSQVLAINLKNAEDLLAFNLNVDPVFNVTFDFQNADLRPGAEQPEVTKETKQVNFNSPLDRIIPSTTVSSSSITVPQKSGGWAFVGYFTHPNGNGLRIEPIGNFFFWQDVILYAHYERLYEFAISNAEEDIPYEENGETKFYKKVATITRKTPTGNAQRELEIFDTIADNEGVYPIVAIGATAFDKTNDLEKLKIGRYVKEIGAAAFFDSRVKEVEFHPEGVLEKIGDQAFTGTINLGKGQKGFNLPATVKYLGDKCFEKSGWGRSFINGRVENRLVINPHLTHIGNWCFKETEFEEVIFNPGVKFKADAVQGKMYELDENDYADSDYYLGWCLFKGCENLKRFYTYADDGEANGLEVISDGMLDIDIHKNKDNIGLIYIELAEGLKSIGRAAFYHQKLLQEIVFPDSLEELCADQKVLGSEKYYPGTRTEVAERGAFEECIELQTITFTEDSQLRVLGAEAFYNCRKLIKVDIPSKRLEFYGDGPFRGCNDLMEVTFGFDDEAQVPEGLRMKIIGRPQADLFFASLEFKVFVNDNVLSEFETALSEGSSGFSLYGNNMRKPVINNNNELVGEMVLIETNSLLDSREGWALGYYFGNDADIYIPDEYDGKPIVTIQTAVVNKTVQRIRLPRHTASIEERAFADCQELRQVIFGDIHTGSSGNFETGIENLVKIGVQAFYKTKIKYFRAGKNLKNIGRQAFWHCQELIWVDLAGSDVGSSTNNVLGNSAFWQCRSLKYVRLPIHFKRMEDSTFADCFALNHVVFLSPNPDSSLFPKATTTYFQGVTNSVRVHIPQGSRERYEELENIPRLIKENLVDDSQPAPEAYNYEVPDKGVQWWGTEW